MDNRKYNILFHLHTVSGIVISVVLFVMFFAGSFSFFRDDINNWQRNESAAPNKILDADFDRALKKLDSAYVLRGRTVEISRPHTERQIIAHMDETKDSLADHRARIHEYIYIDTETYSMRNYEQGYALGEFLYRLHFLAQIPYPFGYYLAGLTALFFLFAIITGVLVHWKKIVSNFYTFRPAEKLKTLWTDAHTGLGMIGLPFQFVYAVTGAFFLINIFLVGPSIATFYDNDDEKFYEAFGYLEKPYDYMDMPIKATISINKAAAIARSQFPNFQLTSLDILNYGDASMHIVAEGSIPRSEKFTSIGKVIMDAQGNIEYAKSPYEPSTYVESVKNILYRIHYGDYAGYGLKIISFVLGIITCFVIISGVMLWLVARDKKKIPEKRRRFNTRVVRVYLAISLSMYPVTALSFIAVKLHPEADMDFLYAFYLITWLLASASLLLKKGYAHIAGICLGVGSVLGFLIPLTNGLKTGNWIWLTISRGEPRMAFIDLFWVVLALLSSFAYFKSRKTKA